jgi:hypothetical protein
MHGKTTIKIIDAQQAKLRNNYKNTKLKLFKTNAAVWFNKMSRIKQVQPNYIIIRINGNKLQDKKKNSAFVGRNNLYLSKMHSKTTIKNIYRVFLLTWFL